jgi:molybdopterin synthase sulfur carrier subunit
MKLMYFAWVREKIGIAEETVPKPDEVTDVESLVDWLKDRGDNYFAAFNLPGVVRVAVNHEHAHLDHPLIDTDEVAIFPPITGG